MSITKRHIDNGDIFLYFDIKNPTEQKISFKLNRFFKLNKISKIINFERYYDKPEFDIHYGENKITGPYAYLDFRRGSAVISKLYYFKELYYSYGDEYSIIYELDEENSDIELKNDLINVNVSNISENCSFFILLSNKKLFKEIKNLNSYFKKYFEGIKNNDVINSYFVKYDGTYTKQPYSIEPFTKDGYGFSLSHSSKNELIPYLKDKKDRYFYDFIVNSIMQTFLYQKSDNGVFFSPYTSTWLKKDTGITAPYIDTRLNEAFNIMLVNFKRIYPKFNIEDNNRNYCDFLIKQAKLNNVYQFGGGLFFPDYFKENLKNKTHTSLNHQIGIINLMFKMYKKTNQKKYLDTFKKMIVFLDATHEMWINPSNKNLYYGLRMQNNQIEMFGDDYIYVTLIDLLLLQKNLAKINGHINSNMDMLIQSKMKYLNNSGFSIIDSNAKLPPGEKINSREVALELYNEYLSLKDSKSNTL